MPDQKGMVNDGFLRRGLDILINVLRLKMDQMDSKQIRENSKKDITQKGICDFVTKVTIRSMTDGKGCQKTTSVWHQLWIIVEKQPCRHLQGQILHEQFVVVIKSTEGAFKNDFSDLYVDALVGQQMVIQNVGLGRIEDAEVQTLLGLVLWRHS